MASTPSQKHLPNPRAPLAKKNPSTKRPFTSTTTPSSGTTDPLKKSAKTYIDSDVTVRVSERQRGNPLLKHFKNVPWAYAKVDADYIVGRSACVLFLSVKYHMLHPKYLLTRMGKLRSKFTVRILLVQVDRTNDEPLQDITRIAFVNGWSLICAWSSAECARYIENFKSYEMKTDNTLRKKVDRFDAEKTVTALLTCVRSVTTRDVKTLVTNFGSPKGIMQAPMDKLAICHGLGPKKVKRIHQSFRQPFRTTKKPEQTPTLATRARQSKQ